MRYYLILLFLTSCQFSFCQYKRIFFQPTVFYRTFSPNNNPVLKIIPGDTIFSESVDAGGFDKTGTRVTERGNPLTGPFYVEGVSKGDVIAVTLTKVSLNRNYATTVEGFVPRSLPKDIIKKTWRNAKLAKWDLDIEKGYAYPNVVHEHLKNFKVALTPFLGCVGVAAPSKRKETLTYFAGPFGGNMDFSKVTQGATIYLPVFHDGAFLYVGDGHAVQGDGELTGDALETSMSFAFVTRIIKKEVLTLTFPRIEDSTFIISVAFDKTLDNALKIATKGLLDWIQQDYHLSFLEATHVIGTSIEYKIPALAGPEVEIAAMLKKEILMNLKKYK